MEKKLPKVYANKIEGKAGNNNDVYCSFDDNFIKLLTGFAFVAIM